MAISKKGLRNVKFKGKHYLWYVKDDQSSIPNEGFVEHSIPERRLHIISSDKKFIVHYRIPSAGDGHTTLKVEGP